MVGLICLFITVTAMVAGSQACDVNVMVSCHTKHINGLQPASGNFCSELEVRLGHYNTCMEAGMEGCAGSSRNQIQIARDTIFKGYAPYDSTCKGSNGCSQDKQIQVSQCLTQMSNMTGMELSCSAVESMAQCTWNMASGCARMELLYKSMVLPSVNMVNQVKGCGIVIQGAPATLPPGCENIAARTAAISQCPLQSESCQEIQEGALCSWKAVAGCSITEEKYEAEVQPMIDMANLNSGCSIVVNKSVESSVPSGLDGCPDLMKCYEDVSEALGLVTTDGISAEEQNKIDMLSNLANVSSICPLVSKVKIGGLIECMQAATTKCQLPFGLSNMLQSGGSQNMMAPIAEKLKLIKSDGTINGTSFDLMLAYMCHPACDGMMEKAGHVFGKCDAGQAPSAPKANQTDAEKKALCDEYQEKMDCLSDNIGACPYLILMLHSVMKPMADQTLNCNINIKIPPPTIPPKFGTNSRDTDDNSGQLLVASTLVIGLTAVNIFL